MRFTRRQFILFNLTGTIALTSPSLILATPYVDADWEILCRKWMGALLPESPYGASANSDAVFLQLKRFMDEQPATARRIHLGLRQLSRERLPNNSEERYAILAENTTRGKLIGFFYKIFTECYYASFVGWSGLGLSGPPQPSGFSIYHQI